MIATRRRIPKATVVSEREYFSCDLAVNVSLHILMHCSQQEGAGSRCCCNVPGPLAKVSFVMHEAGHALSKFELHTYPMLRCNIVSAAARARSTVALPHMQQVSAVRSACSR